MKRGRHYLSPDELGLAQALLDQTRSIDEVARLMSGEDEDDETGKSYDSYHKMQRAIIHHVTLGSLLI